MSLMLSDLFIHTLLLNKFLLQVPFKLQMWVKRSRLHRLTQQYATELCLKVATVTEDF